MVDLQPKHEVARRGPKEARDLVQHLLRLLEVRPAKLGDARDQLHEGGGDKVLAAGPLIRQKV